MLGLLFFSLLAPACVILHLLNRLRPPGAEFRVCVLSCSAAADRRCCWLRGTFHGRAMSVLLDNQFQALPPDKSVNTEAFLEAVSHLPSFFGEFGR